MNASPVGRCLFAAACFLGLGLASCDSTDNLSSISLEPSGISLKAPAALTRAVDPGALFAEIDLAYTTGTETFTSTRTASRTGRSDSWNTTLDVPANADATMDITWYDTMDTPLRADLAALSRSFSTGDPGSRLTLVFDFSEYDSADFDADSDSVTNLVERENGTSPFDSGLVNDPGGSGESPPERIEERTSHTVSIARSSAGASTAVAWRWSAEPIEQGVLEQCGTTPGFDMQLAASDLQAACADPADCAVTFDQMGAGTSEGSAARFSMTVPQLQASVGLTYRLEALDRVQQSTPTTRVFCLIAVNEAPVAIDDRFTVTSGVLLTVTADDGTSLLSNDTDDIDAGNEPLRVGITAVREPERATAFTLLSDGGFTYLHEADPAVTDGSIPSDSFEYEVSDGTLTDTATVTLDIVVTDRPPVATDDIPDQSLVVGIETAIDLSSFFSDPENAELAFRISQGALPPSGDLTLTRTGLLSGVARPGDEGTYSVMIEARDRLSSATGVLALEVRANQRPIAGPIPDIESVESGEVISVDASQGFSDPEGAALGYTLESSPDSGLRINPVTGLISGQIGSPGVYTLTVSASDGVTEPVSSSFTVTQRVAPEPVLDEIDPSALALSAQVNGEASQTIGFGNVGDASLSYTIASDQPWLEANPGGGTLAPGEAASTAAVASCGPTAETRSGTLTVASDGGTRIVSVTLGCTTAPAGILGPVSPDPVALSAQVNAGAYQLVAFGNQGDAPLDYTITGDQPWVDASGGGTVAPGAVGSVEIGASCGAQVETRSGTFTVASDGGSATVTISIACTAPATGALSAVSPTSVTLIARVGTDADDEFVEFGNVGDAPLSYTTSGSQAWLRASPPDGTLAPGEIGSVELVASCDQAAETRSGTLTVSGGEETRTVAVTLECTAVPAGVLGPIDPDPVALSALVGGGADQYIEFENQGEAELSYTIGTSQPWVDASASGTVASGAIESVEVGASCDGDVGTRSGTFTVDSDGGTRTVAISIECTPAFPLQEGILTVNPASVTLAARVDTDADDEFIELGNVGEAGLSYRIDGSEPWLRASPDGNTLAPGDAASAEVIASCDQTVGTRSGTLTVSSDGGTATVAVTLECTAPPAGVLGPVSPDSLTMSDFYGGNGDDRTVRLENLGQAMLSYRIDDDQPWLSTIPSSGTIVPGSIEDVRVNAYCDEDDGEPTSTGTLTISSDGGTRTVVVTLECYPG